MREQYREREERFRAGQAAADSRSRHLAHVRLGAFLLLAVLLWVTGSRPRGEREIPAVAAAAAALAFVALVGWHGRVRREERRLAALAAVNLEAVNRVDYLWDALPPSVIAAPPDHAYSADLDIFGQVSLWRLLGVVSTAPGRPILREWLLTPAPPVTIRERQQAVAELAPRTDLRDALTIGARAAGSVTGADLDRFTGWCERPAWLSRKPALMWLSRLIPATTVLLIVLAANKLAPPALWAVPAVAGVVLTLWFRAPLGATLRDTGARATALHSYATLFALVGDAGLQAPLLRQLARPFETSLGAANRMRGLQRLMELAELRYSPMMHAVVHGLTLWDFHVVAGIERWRADAGIHARQWLQSLGEIEALAAISALHADNPAWVFPEIVESGPARFEASGLGHPLISPAVRVANDVTVGPPGTVLVITGSNMSGKSTLLRAIGLNAVLAQVGAPVCATALRLTPLRPWTSMRIQDSIAAGLSFFMAELTRLKALVDAARSQENADVPPLLYLLDELLQGTNSAERQVAARTVIGHLLGHGAIGAVTTHDLELADETPIAAAARQFHFTETVGPDAEGGVMTFDYHLRPGPATSVNALKLMELIGLR